jgi:hypothetical protein
MKKPKSGLTYLASPYSHKDTNIRIRRSVSACKMAAKLMSEGRIVFSPIAHSHPIGAWLPPDVRHSHEFWMEQDLAILTHCTELVVLKLEGWEKSEGVTTEIEFAKRKGIPITYIEGVLS